MLVALFAAPTASAEDCASFVVEEAERPSDDIEFARALAAEGRRARDADCLEQADRLFEGAHRLAPEPRFVYERILIREEMGEPTYALELLDAYRDDLVRDASISDLVEVDARLREKVRRGADTLPEPGQPPPLKRSTLDTVGPILLAGLGAVSLGLAVYGFTAKCEDTAADGTCLRGVEPAIGPTLAYSAGGVVALTTAAVWWILAIPKPLPPAELSLSGLRLRF